MPERHNYSTLAMELRLLSCINSLMWPQTHSLSSPVFQLGTHRFFMVRFHECHPVPTGFTRPRDLSKYNRDARLYPCNIIEDPSWIQIFPQTPYFLVIVAGSVHRTIHKPTHDSCLWCAVSYKTNYSYFLFQVNLISWQLVIRLMNRWMALVEVTYLISMP